MNRFRDFPRLPTAARFRLAATYALAGMREAAAELIAGASTAVEAYPRMAEATYGTALRDRAIVLDALNALGDTARALPVYDAIAGDLGSRRWLSTQDLGQALGAALPYAMAAASSADPSSAPEIAVEIGSWKTALRLDKPAARLDAPRPAGKSLRATVRNKGGVAVFARLVARGTPPAGGEKPASSGLSLSLRYLGMDGRILDPAAAPAGTDFVVEASVRNRSGYDLANLALSQILPGAWEIVNYRVGAELPKPRDEEELAPAPAAPPYDHQDLRDDRVLTYFSLGAKETKVFKTYANKAYEGSFFLPASTVESMYDERWRALVPGRWLAPPASRNASPGAPSSAPEGKP